MPTITVSGGEVTGPAQIPVAQGSEVAFDVVSDTADEVHVHDYDKLFPVAPGRPAQVRFTATVSGVYEVELEAAGKRLTNVRVQ